MTTAGPGRPGFTPPPGWVPTPQGWVPPYALPAHPSAQPASAPYAPPPEVHPPHQPVPYHRLLVTLPRYRWWKPLVGILLGVGYYVVLSMVFGGVMFLVGMATGDLRLDTLEHFAQDVERLAIIDAASPFSLVFALGSIALMLPSAVLAMLSVGLRPGALHSVGFRLRWRWLLESFIPALAILGVSVGFGILLPGLVAGEWPGPPTTELGTFAACLLVVLVLTPFQAAAEEYVFRGLLAQAIGAWVRYVPLALVIPTVLFAAGHLYDVWGLLDVALFGFAAAVVVWRTGGLEAAITLHTVNNVASFLVLASGVAGTTVNEAETAGPIGPGISIVTMGVWVLWVTWLARRRGVARFGAWRAAQAVHDPVGAPNTGDNG